jgi:hypothetical protein
MESFQIAVQLSTLEQNYIKAFVQHHLKRVQRFYPNLTLLCPDLKSFHKLLQINSSKKTKIDFYQIFSLQVDLLHFFDPSYLALSIKLVQAPIFDKDFIILTPLTQPVTLLATMLEFDTDTGILPVKNTFEGQTFGGPKTLKTLFLQCHPEILNYAAAPFQSWKQLSANKGKIVFEEDTLQTMLSLPHPTFNRLPHPNFNQTMPTDFRFLE